MTTKIPEADVNNLVAMREAKGPAAWFAARAEWVRLEAEYGPDAVESAVLAREMPVICRKDGRASVSATVRKGDLAYDPERKRVYEVVSAAKDGTVRLREPAPREEEWEI